MGLKTDYKNYEFAEGETLRKYKMINNPDGTVSFQDVTQYQQVGDRISASDINSSNTEINTKAAITDLGDQLDVEFNERTKTLSIRRKVV